MTLWETIATLSELAGTSGDEAAVRAAIQKEAETIPGCACREDLAGNLLVSRKGRTAPKQKLLFSAHMDEVGFIVTHVDEKGFLRFTTIGSIDSRVIVGKRLLVGRNRIPGLVGAKAVHMLKGPDREKPAVLKDLYIDIGADSREEALALARPGDRAVYDVDFREIGEDTLLGRALDDRVGCALLLELLKDEPACDFTVAFTVREEVGGNGGPTAAFGTDPDIAVIVENTTAGDVAGASPDQYVCRQGQGPAVSFMDKGTVYDMELYTLALQWAEEAGIPAQAKEGVFGGNDARQIHKTRAGIRPVAVSLPARYIHAPAATVRRSDVEHTLALLRLLRDRLAAL